MKKEMMENATGVKLTKKASKNVIRSLSVGLAAMMALSTPIAAFAEDADGQNSSETTPEESTTTVTTQKSAAEQVGEVQKAAEETSKTTEAAKDAVNAAVDTTIADDSGADQTTKDAAGVLDATANGTFEGGTDVNVAEEIVDKTMDRIKDASDAAADTDAALDKADKKADEANTIADDAKKEQQEAQDAFDKAQAGIDSATDIEEAKNAYNQAAGIVGDAQKAYETAKAAYDSKVAEYNTALDELKAAQAAYDTAVAEASTEAAAAAANLAAVQQKAESLQKAAEEAKTAIPELTDAQKAALEIIALEKERAGDTSTNWRKEDELFKVILKNYYIPELAKGELVDCKWTWNRNDNKNYCEVTYKDVAGAPHTVYLNYKLNDTRDDLVIFEKAEEVVYDVKGTDGNIAFNINAENFPADKLQNDQDTAVYENNGVVYTIVNIGGQFYVVDSASKDVEVNNNYNSEQYETSGEKKTTYSVDENGKLVKTVKQNVSEITYTKADLSSGKTYDSVEAAEKDLADKKAALKDGDKDVETSMSATATADVTVSQKTTFTTTIDLSKIVVEMKKINNDNDKYEKKNAEIAAKELFAKFTNEEALKNLLGGDYKIESINTDNAKVNDTDKYKNTSGRWVDWGADSAAYKNVFSGTIVITYSQTVTAKANAVESKTNAVNAADNKNLEELKDQAYDAAKADAEKLLGDAVSQNKKIKDNLKTGDLHINGYEGWNGKHNSNVAIKIHYADDTFTEGEKTTDQAVVDEKNSSTTLSVSYTGTYQQKNSKDLGAQTVETQKYNQTAKAEEKTAYTSNKYYDEYKKTGEINEGIWLTGKDDNRFPGHESLKSFYDFKDAAAKAEAERAKAEAERAKTDAIIEAAEKAVAAVNAAKADADSLKDKLTALLASQNYTADQVNELKLQIIAAEGKLKEAEGMAKDLTNKLGIAEKTLADKITELTPAPAPGEGGSTTTPGGATTPSGTETTPGGAATTPAGTVTTAAAPASAATTVTTATADAAPVQIAETPVALAAAATPAAATRTAAVANANAAADTDADADTDVTIADEETPLAANGAQESTTIDKEETPLAAEAGTVENKQQEKMSWWWLLIIALLGVTGEEMYRRNKKKKAEAAQKDEK